MRPRLIALAVGTATLLASVVVGVGCGPKADPNPKPLATEVSKFKVTGKVSYGDKVVTFGFVAFYPSNSLDQSGKSSHPAVAEIKEDGTYEMNNAPLGPVMVCVLTDPEIDLNSVYQSGSVAPTGGAGGPPGGGPPGGGGPPKPPGGGPPGGGPPMPGGGGPPGGGPPKPPGPPGGGPKVPGLKKPGATPQAEKLTDAERKLYKDLHAKYGTFGKSPIGFMVAGQSDQNFDIKLTLEK